MQSPLIQNLRWFRAIGDTVFGLGALLYALAVIDRTGLLSFSSQSSEIEIEDENLTVDT
jgi:nitric oxide reductase large subunit